MKFVYKIYSGYDGFTPLELGTRILPGKQLKLMWNRYVDELHMRDEVWIYFHGPHSFTNGVYAKGKVSKVNYGRGIAHVKLSRYSTDHPIISPENSERVAQLVRAHGVQVFYLPEEWQPVEECTALSTADSCRNRKCEWCPLWENLPLAKYYNRPERLTEDVAEFVTGYWAIPRRCRYSKSRLKKKIIWTTDIFSNFKMGLKSLGYPLALGLHRAMQARDISDIDAVIPVPLSPDKEKRKEMNRTLVLAREISKFIKSPVRRSLELSQPISKRRFIRNGGTTSEFEQRYYKLLRTSNLPKKGRVLVVDDVATKGSTLSMCARRIVENSSCEVVAGTPSLMILVAVVKRESELLR